MPNMFARRARHIEGTVFTPLSKHQKQAMGKILRGSLPPEILKRLAAQEKADREAAMRAAADHALAQAEALAAAEAAYKAALPAKLKAEAQARFMANAAKIAGEA